MVKTPVISWHEKFVIDDQYTPIILNLINIIVIDFILFFNLISQCRQCKVHEATVSIVHYWDNLSHLDLVRTVTSR